LPTNTRPGASIPRSCMTVHRGESCERADCGMCEPGTTTYAPARTAISDANGKTTTRQYDPLARPTKVWMLSRLRQVAEQRHGC
jgi:hypothetical protein